MILQHSVFRLRAGISLPAFILLLALSVLSGCGKRVHPHTLVPEYDKRAVRLIAVLPVADAAGNPDVSRLFRQKLLEGLYFKGYPKVYFSDIDGKIASFYHKRMKTSTPDVLPPKDVGAILGVDAVLYTSMDACGTDFVYLYASSRVKARFELYSTRTGEILWSSGHEIIEKNWEITRDRVQMLSCQVYEAALQDIVEKSLMTLPDGPSL